MSDTQPEENLENTETNNGTPKVTLDAPKQEISAATVGRMMGLATISDLKLLDSKVELVSTKVASLVIKLDKALTILNSAPTAADLERIDVQIGSVKTALREAIDTIKSVK
jgi:hypothetical protein